MPTVALTLARFTPADRDDWLAAAAALLSAEERERVESMPAADVRTQHAIGRALLRLVAADTAQRDPVGIAIAIAEDGKPELAEMPELGVSVAHTGRQGGLTQVLGAQDQSSNRGLGFQKSTVRTSLRLTGTCSTHAGVLSNGGTQLAATFSLRRQRRRAGIFPREPSAV